MVTGTVRPQEDEVVRDQPAVVAKVIGVIEDAAVKSREQRPDPEVSVRRILLPVGGL